MNENTLKLLIQKQKYYQTMSDICTDILSGNYIEQSCRSHEFQTSAFRYRILREEEPYSSFQYTKDQLVEMTKDLLSPEEQLFRDVMALYDTSYFYFDFPSDFEETIKNILDDICSNQDKTIIKLRYVEKRTLEEIASQVGLTRERIRQIITKTISHMRRSDILKRMIYGDNAYKEYEGKLHRCIEIDSIIENMNAVNKIDSVYQSCQGQLENLRIRMPEQLSEISIDELDLSVRITNSLKRAGIYSIQDVLNKSDKELMMIRNFGMNCLTELNQALLEKGFRR